VGRDSKRLRIRVLRSSELAPGVDVRNTKYVDGNKRKEITAAAIEVCRIRSAECIIARQNFAAGIDGGNFAMVVLLSRRGKDVG
jgi:hypothetical protein